MSEEKWKVFPNDTRYEVSTSGKCRLITSGKIRTPVCIKNGYMTYMFSSPTKLRYVHVMVLETFVGQRPFQMDASHLDGNRQNNCLSNLVWESTKDNIRRKRIHKTEPLGQQRWSSKLTTEQAIQIKTSKQSQSMLSKTFNISRAQVYRIKSGKNWPHLSIMNQT